MTKQLNDSIDAYTGQHYSLYNAAIDGNYANSNSCAAEVIVSRYHPKLVIYDLSDSQLRWEGTDIKLFTPYYWTDTIVHRYLDNLSAKERALMKSSMYRYNSILLTIAVNFLQSVPEDDGYEPIYGTSIDTLEINKTQTSTKNNISNYRLNAYSRQNFINALNRYKSAHVPLVIVCSPKFRPSDNNQQLMKICDSLDIPFIEFYDSPYFNAHPELFKDMSHLNDAGAHVYTALFFEQLKQYLTSTVDR